jgi:hypothetical protein
VTPIRRALPPGRRTRAALLAAMAACLLGGCGRGDDGAAPPASRPAVAAGMVVVTGTVKFDGPPPPTATLGEQTCCDKRTPIVDESLVVDPAGGVRNVVVYLEDGPNVPTAPPPALLDQQGCRYVPHVLAVRAGQTVQVRSSDPTLHNAHADRGANKPFNLGFTDAGQVKETAFAKPEVAVRVRCDVHQWMSAYVAVFDHPFFAVTGAGGTFEIAGVPPGTYTLVAWHERYGKKTQQVVVADGGSPTPVVAGFWFGK